MEQIKASELFKKIEGKIPLDLALDGDPVGFIGSGDANDPEVEKVLVLMDYLSSKNQDYTDYDLVILHHPPLIQPELPAYVIHSNWDLLTGGACDALAECLNIKTDDVLDKNTDLGRIGNIINGPVPISEFVADVMEKLNLTALRVVNDKQNCMIERVGLISGFGLNPDLIKTAADRGVDLYLSGDLTHPGAIIAKNRGLVLIDASHHATELPGLYRLGQLISEMGVQVHVRNTNIPWELSLK